MEGRVRERGRENIEAIDSYESTGMHMVSCLPKHVDSLNRHWYLHACTYLFSPGKFTLPRIKRLAGQICVLFVAVFWDREIYTSQRTCFEAQEKHYREAA